MLHSTAPRFPCSPRARVAALLCAILAASPAPAATPTAQMRTAQTRAIQTRAIQSQTDPRADPEAASGFAPRPEAAAKRFMIVAANPHAARAGYDILAQGGSAADAAIAAQLALNVVEPQSSGLGGGAFALYLTGATGDLTSYDARETAPAGARADMFLDANGAPMKFYDAVTGGDSVGVPGVPALLRTLHQRHGKLPWARLFEPAIALAEDGFAVSPRFAKLLKKYARRMRALPGMGALFLHSDGRPYAAGERLRNPALAQTLRRLAAGEDFYSGPIARMVADAVTGAARPGTLSVADLAAYRVIERAPLCMPYRAYRVCGMGPPSSGATTVGQILGVLGHFPMPAWGPRDPYAWSAYAQASALAYADRAVYLADPDMMSVPAHGLLDPAYMTLRAQAVNPAAAPGERARAGHPPWREGRMDYAPDHSPERPSTTHISIVDAAGDAISMTSSIETAFGSRIVAGGMLLNNQLTDFSFHPEEGGRPVANAAAPGKRPRSSMAPTMVFRGAAGRKLAAVIGSPGGSRIIGYVAKALIAHLDWGMGPQAAVSLPNVTDRNGGAVDVESIPTGDPVAAELAGLGYVVNRRKMTSGLHMIAIAPDGGLRGGADPRREGVALGD